MTPFLNEGGQDHKQNFCNNLRFKQVSGERLQSFRIYFTGSRKSLSLTFYRLLSIKKRLKTCAHS